MTPRGTASSNRKGARTSSCISRRSRWMASRRSPKARKWSSRSRPARRASTPRTCSASEPPRPPELILRPPARVAGGAVSGTAITRLAAATVSRGVRTLYASRTDSHLAARFRDRSHVRHPDGRHPARRAPALPHRWIRADLSRVLRADLASPRPEYLGWVHDSGLSFRHELYSEYKATREKLTEELQSDFDTGMERICQLLDAYRIPILSLQGYEADDVIGTLAKQGVEQQVNVVIVSGDKDFQQLVRPGVWLLNPGRGGPASVEEQWVSVENGAER